MSNQRDIRRRFSLKTLNRTNSDGKTKLEILLELIENSQCNTHDITFIISILKNGANQRTRGLFNIYKAILSGVMECNDQQLVMRCLPHVDVNIAYVDENEGILHAAVRKQNTDIVQYIVRRLSVQKINEDVTYNRITALHLAAMMKNESITRILLEKQANVHAEDVKGRTPLLYAVKHNKLEQCRLLLQHGGRIESKPKRATKLFNALFCHSKKLNVNIIQLLLDHGLNPNSTDVYGKTLLHRVAESIRLQNAVKCGELLLKYGANINAITRKGDSALHLAADNCSGLPFYELMFEKDADLNISNKKNKTFFDVVIERSEILLEGFIKYLVLAKARGKMDYNFGTVMLNPIEFAEYTQCEKEMSRLKKIEINSVKSLTLWHMIVQDDEKIYRHCLNERLGDIIAEQIEKFPMYKSEIERKYKSVLRLQEAEERAYKIVQEISDSKLNHYVIKRILDYLSKADLEKYLENGEI